MKLKDYVVQILAIVFESYSVSQKVFEGKVV